MSKPRKPRQKRLTIYNTDRYFNLNLMQRVEFENKIKVTKLNEQAIELEMDNLIMQSDQIAQRDDKAYIIYRESYANDRLIQKLIAHAGSITYYTTTTVPYYIVRGLANNPNSEIVYSSREDFTFDEVDNVMLSYMATSVVIDVPVVIPDINPIDLLFMLHPLKTNVDRVQLSFPRLHKEELAERHKRYYHRVGEYYEVKPKVKYRYFKHLLTSLSIWKMNIYLVCDSVEDYRMVDILRERELNKRNPNRVPEGDSSHEG